MTWTATLYSVSRPFVARNLLGFLGDNQTDALAWARTVTGYTGQIPNFKKIYNSSAGRLRDEWPNLMLIRRETKFDEASDDYSLGVTHTFGFEMEVTSADADDLTEKCEVYLAALKSILWACPSAVLLEGFPSQGHATLDVTDDDGDQTRGAGTPFLQTPRVVCTVKLMEVRNG